MNQVLKTGRSGLSCPASGRIEPSPSSRGRLRFASVTTGLTCTPYACAAPSRREIVIVQWGGGSGPARHRQPSDMRPRNNSFLAPPHRAFREASRHDRPAELPAGKVKRSCRALSTSSGPSFQPFHLVHFSIAAVVVASVRSLAAENSASTPTAGSSTHGSSIAAWYAATASTVRSSSAAAVPRSRRN